MTILLSLVAAAAYGLSDFNGGSFSKRAGAWTVSLVAQLAGSALVLLAALLLGGAPTGGDLSWALLGGLGNGFGTAYLYRGLASGRMGVVAPVSGVGAVVVPVLAGAVAGERPGLVVWTGIVLALPAIWLVSREPADVAAGGSGPSGAVDGLIAGLGFGTLFAALAQIHHAAGLYPLALNQVVAGLVIVGVATAVGAPWVPRNRYAAGGITSGALGALATGLFQVATQHGYLAIAAVVTSLYPAFTVVLAATLLHERVHRGQAVGLALCAGAVVLVAGG
jgi:drug/metabolite transporter (DMT)-like permease